MYAYRIRIRNRLLQKLYKPRKSPSKFFASEKAIKALDEIDKSISEKITPLLSDLF